MIAGYADWVFPIGAAQDPRRGLVACQDAPVTRLPSYGDASDGELMAWSAKGDRRAFDEVVNRHGPYALRVAARLLSDSAAAEDVVQDAMVRAWSQAARFDPDRAKLTTWLYRIVVNLCVDAIRRRRPEALPEDFEIADPTHGAQDRLEADERNGLIAKAMGALSDRHRVAMTLVYDEGLSGAETARVMGTSAKAVERMLARAVQALRRQVLPRFE